ncbi:hypothetical protein [Cryptosporangium sp. NPDC051539]
MIPDDAAQLVVAISLTDHAQPYSTAIVRGHVAEVVDGDDLAVSGP